MHTDVAIVGGGHNALVAATYLARAGLRVDLFERRPMLGGAVATEELWPGHFFSTGAHLLHALPAKIARELKLRERGLELVPREATIYLKRDGTYDSDLEVNLPNHRTSRSKLTATEIAGLGKYQEFKRLITSLVRPYLLRVPPTLDELRRHAAGTPAEEALRLATSMKLWEVQDHFLPTERLRERFATESSAVELNPLALAHAYGAIDGPDPETGEPPLWGFVKGGMGRLAECMASAAREAGARLHPGRAVKGISEENGMVTGLRLADGTEVRSGKVLSCVDPKATFLRLLNDVGVLAGLRSKVAGLVSQNSCYKLLAIIKELPRWRGWDGDPVAPSRGSVQFEMTRAAVREAYADLKAGRPPRRPLLSFNVPSLGDSTLAPAGFHTASIYIYPVAPRLAEGDWVGRKAEIAEALIDYITEFAPNFRNSIVKYEFRTPHDLERIFGLTDGCIWHLQHTPGQLLGSRPLPELANYRTPLRGLYLGSAGQHPGGEVSGIPGHNAAQEILRDYSR